ncbi:membrane protein [Pseudoalteromonas sp. A25]|uniref:TonB-dependent receptor plug domain-containing protein n=1 Tax=Pseudoalteromonas sp. A25 TaxID=116092 RepID=UPI001260D17E|nr:TonB-dependent receptor [Pseudoalteromonas sp. A25]BBN81495.1 membrane protein [Pseudoalteromonas sp. A25]
MTRSKLSRSIKAVLIGGIAFSGHHAVANTSEQAADKQIERIVTTGSRISRADVEGPSPIVVLSAQDIDAKGFSNVYEALQSLSSATGSTQGQGITNSFTPNAETVNLRGMGANRTLVLLNGRRVANYPRAFNGQNNVFNLSTISAAAISRIEVLTGGSSAVYGSDAIAGVINIITKTDVDDITVRLRHATTDQGGGDSNKFSIAGGFGKGGLNVSYAVEYSKQDMLLGSERDWLNDFNDGPATSEEPEYQTVNSRSIMAGTIDGGFKYIHPQEFGNNVCDQWDEYDFSERPSRGFYCGRDTTGDRSYINDREQLSLYTNLTYQINNEHEIFAEALYWDSEAANRGGFGVNWGTNALPDGVALGGQWVWDATNKRYLYLGRTFTEQEVGDVKSHFEDEMLYTAAGFRGTVFSDWGYEVSIAHSASDSFEYENLVASDKAMAYFLGSPLEGTTSEFNPNYDRFWKPLDKAGRDAIIEVNDSSADASVTTVNASLTGDLFELDAGPIAFAMAVEWSTEDYEINVDPRTLDRTKGWGNGLTGTEGKGDRDRYGMAVEFRVPVSEQLQASIAGRYDYYDDETAVDGAFTYQLGLEYRPLEALLVRANYGTTFRAPDIHQVFAGPSGFYSSITDYWLESKCAQIVGQQPTGLSAAEQEAVAYQCDMSSAGKLRESQSYRGERTGNKNLKEETGYSATIGFVWSITDTMDLTTDLYRIRIEDQVESWDTDHFFTTEAKCRNGQEQNQALCDDVLSRIDRFAVGTPDVALTVDTARSTYINQSLNEQTGVDVNYKAAFDLGAYGEFNLDLKYTHVLEVVDQKFPGDKVDKEYRDSWLNNDFRSRWDNRFGWNNDDWSVQLQQTRYGSSWNDEDPDATRNPSDERRAFAKRMKPWLIYNLGVTYSINDNHFVKLGVNNLRDSKARNDESYIGGRPWFNRYRYPVTTAVMGRTFSLEWTGRF